MRLESAISLIRTASCRCTQRTDRPDADVLLQCRKRAVDGLQRPAQVARRCGLAAFLGDGQEGLEVIESLHMHSLVFRKSISHLPPIVASQDPLYLWVTRRPECCVRARVKELETLDHHVLQPFACVKDHSDHRREGLSPRQTTGENEVLESLTGFPDELLRLKGVQGHLPKVSRKCHFCTVIHVTDISVRR